jgi:hypothetical protein
MRKGLLAAATCLAVASTPSVATATHSQGSGPNFDTTNGTGRQVFSFFTSAAHVNARSNDGANPRGHFWVEQDAPGLDPMQTFKRQGDVTCHRVSGHDAVVGGRLRTPLPFFFSTFRGAVIVIRDNGEPGAGRDRSVILLMFEVPESCPEPFEDQFFDPIERGNFIVHDG